MENNAKQNNDEEILLFSTESPTEPSFDSSTEETGNTKQHTVSVKFNQINRETLHTKHLCIYDSQFLEIKEYQYKNKLQFWLNLAYVNTKPKRQWDINWNWAWLTLLFSGLVVLFQFTPILPLITGNDDYLASGIVILVTLSLLCFIMLIRGAKHVAQFSSLHGKVRLFELFINKPSRAEFQTFLMRLHECGEQAKSSNHLNQTQQLAAEMSEHRRLRDQNVISAEDYDRAKSNLLSKHSS